MKTIAIICLVVCLLFGCSQPQEDLQRAMALRSALLSKGASFSAKITADYGDVLHSFSMDCQADSRGEITFTVTEPQSIAGITGKITAEGGKLTFDDQALAFATMADGLISPVSGPWILMKTLRSGYLTASTQEAGQLRLSIDDSYADDALHLDIWLGEGDVPVAAEVLWQGRRLLSIQVTNFTFL